MNYFSIQCASVNNVAEKEKQMAAELYSIAATVSSVLRKASGNSALKAQMRSVLSNEADGISEQQEKMARLSAVLYETTAEYEAAEKSVLQLKIIQSTINEITNQAMSNIGTYSTENVSATEKDEVRDAFNDILQANGFLGLTTSVIEGITTTAADGHEKLMKIWNSDKSVDEMITEGFKVFNDTVLFPMKGTKTIGEWIKQKKIEWPKEIKGTMEFVEKLDEGIDLYNAFKDYTVGLTTDDSKMAAKGAGGYVEFVVDVIKDTKGMKDLKKSYGFSPYNPVSLLVDYGTNMVKNWMETIVQDGATTQEVYYQTFMHSALEVGMDCVLNKTTMAAAYYPLDAALSLVGVDLKGMYERVSDKEGIAMVMDATGELKDLILENSSWEDWKNGMSIMGDYISDGFKSLGEGAKNLWNKIF